jgi:hypothetical protein
MDPIGTKARTAAMEGIMKVERTQHALASASRDRAQFAIERRVNATTDLTRDETESRRQDTMPEHREEPQGDQPNPSGGVSEKGERLLNITA